MIAVGMVLAGTMAQGAEAGRMWVFETPIEGMYEVEDQETGEVEAGEKYEAVLSYTESVVNEVTTSGVTQVTTVYEYAENPINDYLKEIGYLTRFEGEKEYWGSGGAWYQVMDDEKFLIVDFSLSEGDTVTFGWDEYTVTKVDYIEVKGRQYKRLEISSVYGDNSYLQDIWVEGIGSQRSLYMVQWPVPTYALFPVAGSTQLMEVWEDGELIFEYADFETDNIVLGVNSVSIDSETSDSSIYDLQGRRLTGIPSHGLYIQNGKTYVAQ